MGDELTIIRQFHNDFYEKYQADPIVDVEPFFDERYKDSGLTITTVSGDKNTIVFNELLKVFNGWWPSYKSPIYFNFQDELYAPLIVGEDASKLHKMNSGPYLDLFGSTANKLKVSFICSPSEDLTSIFASIAATTGDQLAINSIEIETKEGETRTILSSHFRYNVREGKHSVPLRNEWTSGQSAVEDKPLRSEWIKVTINMNYSAGVLRKIRSANIFARQSFH